MRLERFARVPLAHLPTPLEPLERLSAELGGPDIRVKRDDCTGLGTGGNKTRKLEFLMGEALEQGADTIITIGAVQSNHVRQTAAAAARLGLACHALLEKEVPIDEAAYRSSGNVLLDGLFDARLSYHEHGADLRAIAEERAAALRSRGRRPYIVPVGGSNATGALGYVDCARELLEQLDEQGLSADHLVLASGSAGTQGGLLAGLQALGSDLAVTGISVSAGRDEQAEKVRALCAQTIRKLGLEQDVPDERIRVDADQVGPGYGRPTEGMREAVERCARLEGLLLDPVYSGKAMAGLFDHVRRGRFGPGETVVFLHTGGSAGLFAYDWFFNAGSASATSA